MEHGGGRSLLVASGTGTGTGRGRGAPAVLPAVALGLLMLFLAMPGSVEHKAHALLHGLCAQRPSHSLEFGGQLLPFDARMTGIYGGFAVAVGYLLVRGRLRAFRVPPRSVLVVLAGFVGAMAVDGANSLLVDLGFASAYEPDNRLRLATGLLTGTALAVALCFLLATTLWRRNDWERSTVERPRELLTISLLQVPLAGVLWSGVGPLHAPLSLLLVAAATAVVAAMALVVVLLVRRLDQSFDAVADLQGWAAVALVLGVVAMGVLAGGRYLLERAIGVPPLT